MRSKTPAKFPVGTKVLAEICRIETVNGVRRLTSSEEVCTVVHCHDYFAAYSRKPAYWIHGVAAIADGKTRGPLKESELRAAN